MAPMEMHHAMTGAGTGATALRLVLVVAVVAATAVHVRLRRPRTAGPARRPVWGHALMGVAMTTMLLPDTWRTLSPAVWEPVFLVVAVLGAAGAVRRWRAGDGGGARHDADLVVGAVAMEAMCRGSVTNAYLVGLLAAYFVVQALAAVAAWPGRVGWRVAAPAPASRAVLAAVMAYMLVGH